MAEDLGPFTRLIEEHRRNQANVSASATTQPRWALPLGFVAPWVLVAAALASRNGAVVFAVVSCFALLVPIGLVCLFAERLQPVSAGLVLGTGSSLFTAAVLLT